MKRLIWSLILGMVLLAPASSARAAVTYPDVMLVFDVSSSMRGERMAAAKTATTAFVGGLPSDVRVGLLTFSTTARTRVAPTTDREALIGAIAGLRATGDTALYDAISKAAAVLRNSMPACIVVLSDGADNNSSANLSQLLRQIRTTGVIVDAVALQPTKAQLSVMRQIVRVNSGVLVAAQGADKLLAAFEKVVVVSPTSTPATTQSPKPSPRSEEHTSELQSH